jgi:hypothetical protein
MISTITICLLIKLAACDIPDVYHLNDVFDEPEAKRILPFNLEEYYMEAFALLGLLAIMVFFLW